MHADLLLLLSFHPFIARMTFKLVVYVCDYFTSQETGTTLVKQIPLNKPPYIVKEALGL